MTTSATLGLGKTCPYKKTHTFFCPYNCEFLLAFKKNYFNLLLYLFIYSFQNFIVCMHKYDYIFDKFEQKSSPIAH